MKMLVLGASGRCGSQLTRQAARRRHDVTAVARNAAGYRPPKGVNLRHGEVTQESFLASILPGHHVVLSCLGLRRASILPWSRLLSPPDLVQTVVGLLEKHVDSSTRVIWISAGGVGDSRAAASWPVRRMIDTANIGVAYADLEAAEAHMEGDGNRWLAVRPVTLVNGPPTGTVGEVFRYGLLSTVRRGDVAAWMLDVADGTRSYDRRTVLLGRPSVMDNRRA